MPLPGLDPNFWSGRRVLLTGHTGFKGGWAALWLARMGARLTGLAMAPETDPDLFTLAGVEGDIASRLADLRDAAAVREVVAEADPEIVLHMAAQPLVRRSIREPVEAVAVNVLGTAHLLDALRGCANLRTALVVTSDKVYANSESGKAFDEGDRLGGKDPYSGSKAACEVVTSAFAQTYFGQKGVVVATARGGNVIGGGDFAEDRIVPDIVRAAQAGETLVLRHPEAVRPWQHVLDCVAGYLAFIEALDARRDVPRALNFGPEPTNPVTVGELADRVQAAIGVEGGWRHEPVPGSVEMKHLTIDAALARRSLGWHDRLPGDAGVAVTADWYGAWLNGADMRAATLAQIDAYGA